MFHVEHGFIPQIVLPIGEPGNRLVARLHIGLGEVDAATQKAGGRAGLEAAEFKPEFDERGGETLGRCFARAPARLLVGSNVHEPAQKGAGGDDDSLAEVLNFQGGLDPSHDAVAMEELRRLSLLDVETWLLFADPFEAELVGLFIGLRARSPDGGTAFRIEHPKLEAGKIGVAAHLAAERVDFAGEMAFGESTHGGVA